ncbi:MAG TPA: AraC family transcriptional regulator [Allosphingosinicella sp.]|nr:AraC family transcriptional regulator [Allosphingosinicella sp.]
MSGSHETLAVHPGEPTVAAGLVKAMLRFAAEKGVEADALARQVGIKQDDLEDHHSRVPFARYAALLRRAKRLAGDPALALHFGESVNLAEVSLVGLIGYAAETMMEAFIQLNRFSRLIADVDTGGLDRWTLARDDPGLWIVDNRRNSNDFPEATEIAFSQMVSGTRQFGDTPFVLSVQVTHQDPGYRTEYERILGAPVEFGSHRNAMLIDEAWTTHRMAVHPRYVFGILSEHARALLKGLEDSKSLRGRVESLIMPILHTANVGIEGVAAKLGCSSDALYRRLKGEGLTFEKILDELRHNLALHYLSGGKVSVTETAYLVGFSDPAAFSRAFKRWTGISPSAHRRPAQTPT